MIGAFLVGRLIVGGYFIFNGLNHFLSYPMFVQAAASKGVPLPEIAIPVSGALLLFGGASILLGWLTDYGIAAIVLFLAVVSPYMHDFWAQSGMERMNQMINFTKNMALLGSTLIFAAVPKPWPYSVGAPRRVVV